MEGFLHPVRTDWLDVESQLGIEAIASNRKYCLMKKHKTKWIFFWGQNEDKNIGFFLFVVVFKNKCKIIMA